MPNPKRKHTPSRRDMRRSKSQTLELKSLSVCPQCDALRLPHRVCPSCGFYNGRLEVPRKEKKKEEEQSK